MTDAKTLYRFGCESGPWGMGANVTMHLGHIDENEEKRTLCGRSAIGGRWSMRYQRAIDGKRFRVEETDCKRCLKAHAKLSRESE